MATLPKSNWIYNLLLFIDLKLRKLWPLAFLKGWLWWVEEHVYVVARIHH